MKIFIGPSGCDLVLEALKNLQKETKNDLRSTYFCNTYHHLIYMDDATTKERNLRSLIGVYEALKNSYTEEDLKENLLWTAKEE